MFWTRLISGVVLVVIALATMWLGGPFLAGILLLISLAGYRELTKAQKVNMAAKGFNGLEVVGFGGIVIYYAVMYFWQDTTPAADVHCAAVHGGDVPVCDSVSQI